MTGTTHQCGSPLSTQTTAINLTHQTTNNHSKQRTRNAKTIHHTTCSSANLEKLKPLLSPFTLHELKVHTKTIPHVNNPRIQLMPTNTIIGNTTLKCKTPAQHATQQSPITTQNQPPKY
eukprot:gene3507-2458_t